MLLRAGVISMAFALTLAAVVAVIVVVSRDESEGKLVTAKPTAAGVAEADPQSSYWPRPKPDVKRAKVQTKPASEPKREPKPHSLPVIEGDWPNPKSKELKAANGPRRYGWVSGAIMTLTVKRIGIYNAPVMGTDSQQALDNGIAHVPETSRPWDRSAQRNVYLAGHRLGYAGTGSRMIFYNLDKLRAGDEVLLKDRRGNRYKYRVSETFMVGPEESWVMGQLPGRDMVTLQTCTGPNFEKRLIVRADRV